MTDANSIPITPSGETPQPTSADQARAYVALGSNEGDRLSHLSRAIERIAKLPETELVALSPVYESEPAYHTQQDPFANAVLEIRTALPPLDLLGELQRLELEAGRVRTFPNAPRPLDLDILDYEGVCSNDESLVLPHPRLLERDFTVTPLLDIAPTCVLANGVKVGLDHVAYGKVLRRLATLELPGEAAEAAAGRKRRRGRPRKNESEKAARQSQIVNVAIRLFLKKPYRETTMSDIAEAAGLDQSSLYYWFKSKEDLLDAILQESQASMRLAIRVSSLRGSKPLHLYAVIYTDVVMMCDLPFDYFDLEAAALAYPERLQTFFETYRALRGAIEAIIHQGVENGDLTSDDPATSVSVALSITEGLQHQYHRALATGDDPATGVWSRSLLKSKHDVAKLAADTVIETLMPDPDVDALHREAIEQSLVPAPGSKTGAAPDGARP